MPDPPIDLGTRLREARLRRDWTLRDLAAVTKIPVATLAAIERNEFDRLPEGIFRRAYVRAFAAEVGVNADPLPASLLPNPEVTTQEVPTFQWRRQMPTALTIALLIAVFLLARGTWNKSQQTELPEAPGAFASAGPVSPDEASGVSLDRAGAVVNERRVTLTMRFAGPCWISAIADGDRAVHRLVATGELLALEARETIVVEIGNAGVVEAVINGEPARILGRPGEVLRLQVAPPSGERAESST